VCRRFREFGFRGVDTEVWWTYIGFIVVLALRRWAPLLPETSDYDGLGHWAVALVLRGVHRFAMRLFDK
jgi:hypothetical protein